MLEQPIRVENVGVLRNGLARVVDLGRVTLVYRYFVGQGLGENSPIAVQGIDFTYTGNRVLYIAI